MGSVDFIALGSKVRSNFPLKDEKKKNEGNHKGGHEISVYLSISLFVAKYEGWNGISFPSFLGLPNVPLIFTLLIVLPFGE